MQRLVLWAEDSRLMFVLSSRIALPSKPSTRWSRSIACGPLIYAASRFEAAQGFGADFSTFVFYVKVEAAKAMIEFQNCVPPQTARPARLSARRHRRSLDRAGTD